MEKKEEKKVCCICGKEYEGYGYNPFLKGFTGS